ncbi:MAG: hypothetical protein AAFQ53_11025 [Bacteroidota bacterium]
MSVRAYSNATTLADETTVDIPVRSTGAVVYQAATEVNVTIPPIAEPTTSSLSVRLVTGRDDLRRGGVIYFHVLDPEGNVLTNGRLIRQSVITRAPLQPGEERTVTIPLVRAVPLSSIHRIAIVGDLAEGIVVDHQDHHDNWDLEAMEITAAGRTLLDARGTPLVRFTEKVRSHVFQIAPPSRTQTTSALGVLILNGSDGMRGGGRVTAQAFDRSGSPLSRAVLLTSGGASWDEDAFVIAPVPLNRAVAVQEIGSVVIEHESVQSGPFDSSDDWDVARVQILSARPSSLLRSRWADSGAPLWERPAAILHTASGDPVLHRFSDGSRELRLTLPR